MRHGHQSLLPRVGVAVQRDGPAGPCRVGCQQSAERRVQSEECREQSAVEKISGLLAPEHAKSRSLGGGRQTGGFTPGVGDLRCCVHPLGREVAQPVADFVVSGS